MTHDLNFLCKRLETPDDLTKICKKITNFYVESRYPDSYTEFNKVEVSGAIEDARGIIVDEKEDIIKKLTEFKKDISRLGRIDKMIFFGSLAKNMATENSDIDLLIVSEYFKGIKMGRGAKLYDYWNLPYPVDFICYTPDEFRRLFGRVSIVSQAVREGTAI